MTSKHRTLCVQFRPDAITGLDAVEVTHLFKRFAENNQPVRFDVIEGGDDGRYINFLFETENLIGLWTRMREDIFAAPVVGALIANATVTTCEGEHGWNDYLLLHHFNRAEKIDSLD